jgi:hypothetical protein
MPFESGCAIARALLVSWHDQLEGDLGAGLVIGVHDVGPRWPAEPGRRLHHPDVDSGTLTPIAGDDPDRLAFVKAAAFVLSLTLVRLEVLVHRWRYGLASSTAEPGTHRAVSW